MSKVIGICEYHHHWEFFNTLYKITEPHDIVTFKDYKEAQKADYLDLLFVDTINPVPWDILKWVRWKPKCKTILTIHEVNTDFFALKPILHKFDAFNVVDPLIRDAALLRYAFWVGKPVFNIPYAVFEDYYDDWFNPYYVVPGRIERFRRDYEHPMLDGFDPLCFLGEPIGRYGRRVKGLADLSFDGYVSNDTYEDILKGCRGVVAPLRNPTRGYLPIFKEWYGRTKMPGAFFSAVKYGKPFYSNIPGLKFDLKDYSLDKWRDYFEKEVLGTLL